MIKKLEISGVHTKLNADITKYILKKIATLDKYLPRAARPSAHGEIKLIESKIKTKKQFTCEAILHLPHGTLICKETTINSFAAVDIVEAKLKNQIKTYKSKHAPARLHNRIIHKLKRFSS